jgi:hypothetical protein
MSGFGQNTTYKRIARDAFRRAPKTRLSACFAKLRTRYHTAVMQKQRPEIVGKALPHSNVMGKEM